MNGESLNPLLTQLPLQLHDFGLQPYLGYFQLSPSTLRLKQGYRLPDRNQLSLRPSRSYLSILGLRGELSNPIDLNLDLVGLVLDLNSQLVYYPPVRS